MRLLWSVSTLPVSLFLSCKCSRSLSTFCSNEFRTLLLCIMTFGPLRKCTKPHGFHSHHIRSHLYGQMPQNVVLVAVLIIREKSYNTKGNVAYLALESPRWYRQGLNHLQSFESQPASAALGLGARPFAQKEFISWHQQHESLDTRQAHHHNVSHPGSFRKPLTSEEHFHLCLPFHVTFLKYSPHNNLISLKRSPLILSVFCLWLHLTDGSSDIRLLCHSLAICQNIFFLTRHITFKLYHMGHKQNINSAYERSYRDKDKHFQRLQCHTYRLQPKINKYLNTCICECVRERELTCVHVCVYVHVGMCVHIHSWTYWPALNLLKAREGRNM